MDKSDETLVEDDEVEQNDEEKEKMLRVLDYVSSMAKENGGFKNQEEQSKADTKFGSGIGKDSPPNTSDEEVEEQFYTQILMLLQKAQTSHNTVPRDHPGDQWLNKYKIEILY